ncbi:MAG: extensin family protein [Polyangiaceae bacterium]|nr:extensin family protein [Polyangiaceae bacterium]
MSVSLMVHLPRMKRAWFAFAAFAIVYTIAPGADARRRKPRVRYQDVHMIRPAAVYADMSKKACLAELSKRKIAHKEAAKSPGVLAPVRLTSNIGGVTFRSDAPERERNVSSAEVFDCRLVLALHDWSKILASHGIDEVRTITAWRPPPRSWPRGKQADRHPGALAVDIRAFGKKTAGKTPKVWLSVEKDFRGKIGAPVCGKSTQQGATDAAKTLRAVLCEASKKGLFTSILTPNYDRAHRDHVHVEIRPHTEWTLFL